MGDFDRLMTKIRLLEDEYSKEILAVKQEQIYRLYIGLKEELQERIENKDVRTEIVSGDYDVTVRIISPEELLISEYDVYINKLVRIADFKSMKSVMGKVVLELWFRCWEYCKREGH